MTLIPQRLVGEALLRSAQNTPSKIALVDKDMEYSYDTIRERSLKLANHLIRSGIQKGDRVAIYMNNSWQCAVSIFAVSLAGGVFLVINPQTKSSKLQYILTNSGSKVLISVNILITNIKEISENLIDIKEFIFSRSNENVKDINPNQVSLVRRHPENDAEDITYPNIIPVDLAALILLPGSTGFPKGVMITHQSSVL